MSISIHSTRALRFAWISPLFSPSDSVIDRVIQLTALKELQQQIQRARGHARTYLHHPLGRTQGHISYFFSPPHPPPEIGHMNELNLRWVASASDRRFLCMMDYAVLYYRLQDHHRVNVLSDSVETGVVCTGAVITPHHNISTSIDFDVSVILQPYTLYPTPLPAPQNLHYTLGA